MPFPPHICVPLPLSFPLQALSNLQSSDKQTNKQTDTASLSPPSSSKQTPKNIPAIAKTQIEKKKKRLFYTPPIPQTLRPARQAQRAKHLRLHLDRHVEPLHHGVRAHRHPAARPQEHHRRRQTFRRFRAVVPPDLRHQLDAPEDGADGAEDGGGGRDSVLWGHCLLWWGGGGWNWLLLRRWGGKRGREVVFLSFAPDFY